MEESVMVPPHGICCYEKGCSLILNKFCIRILSPPDTWEYSNCPRSKGIIAYRLSVVLTEPPFRYGSIFNPATVMAISPWPEVDCFGYRSRSAVRSLICNGNFPQEKVMAAYLRLAPHSCFVFEYRIWNFQGTSGSVLFLYHHPYYQADKNGCWLPRMKI